MTARDLIARVGKDKTLDGRIQDIEATVRSARVAGIKAKRLSDIAPDLGVIESGEFRVGNGVTPGAGFTGGRMAWPEMEYGGQNFFLAGVSNDVIQVGLGIDDGKLYAGAGNVLLDANGLKLTDVTFGRVRWYTDSAFNNAIGYVLGQGNGASIQSMIVSTAAATSNYNVAEILLTAGAGDDNNPVESAMVLRADAQASKTQINFATTIGAGGIGMKVGGNQTDVPNATLDINGGGSFLNGIGTSGTLNVQQAFTVSSSRVMTQASAFLNLQQSGTLVIGSASITAKGSRHRVDGSGAATQTDLEAVNNMNDGDIIVLQTVSNARDVKLRHNTTNGNLFLSNNADRTLGVNTDMFVGIYNADASGVVEWGKI